jgi:hypothetical protein
MTPFAHVSGLAGDFYAGNSRPAYRWMRANDRETFLKWSDDLVTVLTHAVIDADTLVLTAVEEMLRWTSPVKNMPGTMPVVTATKPAGPWEHSWSCH